MDALVHRGDPEELLLEIDRLCAAGDWDGLVSLRERCEAAVELGKQLWPVARFADYRLALEAPGPYAAAVCRPDAGRFTLGPLTEVVAVNHRWEELADHLPSPWAAASVAQERVLRGEDLRGDSRAHAEELDLPLTLLDWEPDYPLPTYRSHELVEGGPEPLVEGGPEPLVEGGPEPAGRAHMPAGDGGIETGVHPAVERALRDLGATWSEQSSGSCETVSVRGGAEDALRALVGEVTAVSVRPAGALARVAWAAASGGAHGRRRGMAAGRSSALWLCHAATGLGFPSEPDRLGEAVAGLRWFVADGTNDGGWSLRLAVEHPGEGWAAAVDARDERRD